MHGDHNMKNDQALKALWRGMTRGAQITVEQELLFASLQNANRLQKVMRAYEFSDIFGGLLLFFIVALLAILKPSVIAEISFTGKIGAAILVGTFLCYHFMAFRIERIPLPNEATLRQIVQYEKAKLSRRIALVSNLGKYLLVGLTGCFMLFNSIATNVKAVVAILICLLLIGALIYFLARKELREQYLPLKAEIDEKLKGLQEGGQTGEQ